MKFSYRLTQLGASSAKYGLCEVCGKNVEHAKNLKELVKVSEVELHEKLLTVQSKLSPEVYDYLFGEVKTVKTVTVEKTSSPNGDSLYCKVLKEFFVNGKTLRMAIKEVYGSDSIKMLEKAVKNVIWSGKKNGVINVIKSASYKNGIFTEPEIELTDKGLTLIC